MNINDTDLLKHIETITGSTSLCLAKWYNATIWLGSGMSTSCHHPPAHYVHVDDILTNPKAIHNTPEKKKDRAQMLDGQRPDGCSYCWRIEDMNTDAISDRVYKTSIYTEDELVLAKNTAVEDDVDLRTLEIAFDRSCNFACSYCNPAFSTTWAKDINTNGPYQDLISDGRNHYTHAHNEAQRYKPKEVNPYVEAFFQWWDSDLHKTLRELRITGGEPLMSPSTWRLLDWFEENRGNSNTTLALNTNLVGKRVREFIDRTHDMAPVDLYTSCEAMSEQAEYIRDGLIWQEWLDNLEYAMSNGNLHGMHVMCTINALCLDSLPEFLSMLLKLKNKYTHKVNLNFTLNIVRFPSFQSPLVLPDNIRNQYKENLETWLSTQLDLPGMETNHVQRLIDYLDIVKTPHDDAFDKVALDNDIKQFYKQYDQRRNKDFCKTFPNLANWYNNL